MTTALKTISYQEFISKFSQFSACSCFTIYGTEDYLKKKGVEAILNSTVPPEYRELDYVVMYGDDVKAAEVVENLETNSFLSDKRLILLKKFDSLRSGEQQKLIQALEKGNSDNVLILLAESFDSRLKVSKTLLKIGPVVQCKSPYKHEEMLPWLYQEVKDEKKKISEKAATLFVNRVDLDYMTASQELEKLLIYCMGVDTIDTEHIQICTGNSIAYTIFDLINEVGAKEVRKSLIILENMLENDESILMIIAMLSRFFLQIWRINSLRKRRVPDGEIMSKHLNDVFYSFRSNHLRYASKYPIQVIPEIFSIMLEADVEIKSTDLEHKVIIERMIFRILSL